MTLRRLLLACAAALLSTGPCAMADDGAQPQPQPSAAAAPAAAAVPGDAFRSVDCDGTYPHHLQGVCTDGRSMFWSFTTTLVRTDFNGRVLNKVAVANHHGDLCHAAGKLYVAVNLGRFNDPAETADSWVYVYDAASLEEVGRHPLPEVVYGAGGMDVRDGRYFVVGGLPDGAPENFIYEYDARFRFVRRHALKSGPTRMGIQAAAFAHGRWWLGCYGSPPVLLVADSEFASVERFEFNASLGVAALPDGRMIAASGRCEAGRGCTGRVSLVTPDDDAGLVLVEPDRGARVPQE